jgi:hypothetical protein
LDRAPDSAVERMKYIDLKWRLEVVLASRSVFGKDEQCSVTKKSNIICPNMEELLMV